ncbi:MAG: urease accessory protein UreE [Proteobacteria bacterium]|nr:urease accessory protein UreE [Pseudomonadota bacterium]
MLNVRAIADTGPTPYDVIVLNHDERHLRRRLLKTAHDEEVLVDLPQAVRLRHGQRLVLEDGRHLEIIAGEEPVYEITAKDAATLARIAWHVGNRHARAEIANGAIVIAADHVLKDMLEGLGARVRPTDLPFEPDPPILHGVPHHHAHD